MFRLERGGELHRAIQPPNCTAILFRDLAPLLNVGFVRQSFEHVLYILAGFYDLITNGVYVAICV